MHACFQVLYGTLACHFGITSSTFCTLCAQGCAATLIGPLDNQGGLSVTLFALRLAVASKWEVRRCLPGCARRHFGVTVKDNAKIGLSSL